MTSAAQNLSQTVPFTGLSSSNRSAVEMLRSVSITVAADRFKETGDSAQLREILVGVIERCAGRQLSAQLGDAQDDLHLIKDLGIDSLTMMEIIMHIEDVLPVSIHSADLDQMQTLGNLQQLIERNISEQRRSGTAHNSATFRSCPE